MLQGYTKYRYPVGCWTSEKDAVERYNEISGKIESGDYKMHLYSNGDVEMEMYRMRWL